jgi:predicted acyltransferase
MGESQARYLALDVFRGMTVCFMIIVNSPGSWEHVYGPLLHADWHGFTPTDLVFPSFLFAVGNAMAFVMHKYDHQPGSVFWTKIFKRTFIIFALGYLMYWFPFFREAEGGGLELKPLAETRILGVLQRIALCYFFASIIIHYGTKKLALWFGGVALVGYWILAYAFGEASDPYSLTGNAALKLDLFLLGPSHLYDGEGMPFDPEGILSTLPAIVNVIAGYLAGDYLRRQGNSYEAVAKLMIAGCVVLFSAFVWDLWFPINKKIWTSSFALLTIGLDLLILPILIYVIELQHSRRWTKFFVVFGRNPLFIYLLADVVLTTMYLLTVNDKNMVAWLHADVLGSFSGPVLASFLFALLYMLFNWSVGYILDRKRIYIKV